MATAACCSRINVYDLGQMVYTEVVFRNGLTGALIDPDDVFLSIEDPSGTVTELVYGVDVAVVQDSTGKYHANIDADQAGTWEYLWFSTGDGQAAAKGSFTVNEGLGS